ncbi:hypothetical protein PAXRUDRAFT_467297 [Paxillus rubicundulus Ve08.2h10]|uniref:HTH La-type RNA-binding domain-containing protein n=1 Tax=Paxillus rubicundulus Ve08.2h10 TaxID=930991 RepID=A0A0D0DAN6_9AGAM|nr:hypothetical protein PAXRUDRAFT_467297 [Paxillus rubicundulus Ve08.2h10]
MVSSVPAPLRNPAETYAERAKKAQSSYLPSTRSVESQATASRSSSSAAPSTSRSFTSISAFPPPTGAFSLGPRLCAPSSSGRTVDARSVDTASEAAVLGNDSRTGTQASPTTSTTLKGPPVVNIWAERMKEKKAQAQLHGGEKRQQSNTMLTFPSGPSQSVSSQKASSLASSQAGTKSDVHRTSRAPVPTPTNSVATPKLASSDQHDDHDPFVVRVPPHLFRQSSSDTNSLPVVPAVDLNGWSEVSKSAIGMQRSRDNSHSAASTSDPKGSAGDHSSHHSAVSSTKNNNTSSRIHSYSRSGSAQLRRVHSRNHSRSGSSASSPRLQMRGRKLPDEDAVVAEPRYEHQRRSSYHYASPGTSDQSGYQSGPYPNGPVAPVSESPYYRRAPGPPLLDMARPPPRHAQNFIPAYALLPQYPAGHIPGHTSPHLATGHHSGPSTPPYPHYPPYPPYIFSHPSILWGDILPPAQPNPDFQDHPDISHNHINSSAPQMGFDTQAPVSPVISTEPCPPNAQATELENGHPLPGNASPQLGQAKPSRVVFGTFNVMESGDESSSLLLAGDDGEHRRERTDDVEHAIEQFTAFSIGVGPDESGPMRHVSRKASVRSLSKPQISPPTAQAANGSALVQNSNSSDVTVQSNHELNSVLPRQAEGSSMMKPVKWKFGTTLCDGLDDERRPPSSSPPPSHSDPQNHFSDISVESYSLSLARDPTEKQVSDQPVTLDFLGLASANNDPAVAASPDVSLTDHSMEKSEDGSISSDVWVVKDYGYGFGDMSGCGNAPDVVQWEMKEREKARIKENYREREMILEQCQRDRERGWVHPGRQLAWRHENGVEDERVLLEQHVDAPRGHMRPRRGSYPGSYVGHERGGHAGRRGRGFGGGYHGGRHSGGRGGSHHRPASLPYTSSPFEIISPSVDIPNGYGHPLQVPSYTPPEHDPYQVVPPPPVPAVPVPPPTFPYPMDATRTYLLGQLEYYLSSQNLAQDFFLRQRVSCGSYSGSRTD